MPQSLPFIIGIGTHGNVSSEARALAVGVKYYRTDITLNQTQVSHIREESARYGASYLGILDYDTVPGGHSNTHWNLSVWDSSVAAAVSAYPEISTWEVWNEPLVPLFQTGYVNGSPYNYYMLIKSTYETVKAIEPNATIVCFGGAPIYDPPAFYWYAEVWSYGASKYCSAISIHAYTFDQPQDSLLLNESNNAELWAQGLAAYENMTGKPIWITETGMPAYSTNAYYFNQSVQKDFLVQAMDFFNGFKYVKRVYWYDLWGLSGGNDFGLLNLSEPGSGAPNAAWAAFLLLYNDSSLRG